MLFPEYGARVRIAGLCDYGDGTCGTIISAGVDAVGLVVVQLDTDVRHVFDVAEVDVMAAPSNTAYTFTQRRSVDEVLVSMINTAESFGVEQYLSTYTSAVIFEMYRLNNYAEQVFFADFDALDDADEFRDFAEEAYNAQLMREE